MFLLGYLWGTEDHRSSSNNNNNNLQILQFSVTVKQFFSQMASSSSQHSFPLPASHDLDCQFLLTDINYQSVSTQKPNGTIKSFSGDRTHINSQSQFQHNDQGGPFLPEITETGKKSINKNPFISNPIGSAKPLQPLENSNFPTTSYYSENPFSL